MTTTRALDVSYVTAGSAFGQQQQQQQRVRTSDQDADDRGQKMVATARTPLPATPDCSPLSSFQLVRNGRALNLTEGERASSWPGGQRASLDTTRLALPDVLRQTDAKQTADPNVLIFSM